MELGVQPSTSTNPTTSSERREGEEEVGWALSYTTQEIRRMQSEDPDIATILKWLEEYVHKPTGDCVLVNNAFVRNLWLLWDSGSKGWSTV